MIVAYIKPIYEQTVPIKIKGINLYDIKKLFDENTMKNSLAKRLKIRDPIKVK